MACLSPLFSSGRLQARLDCGAVQTVPRRHGIQMKIARVLLGGEPSWAVIEGDNAYQLEGERFSNPKAGAAIGPLSAIKLLIPLEMRNNLINLLSNWRTKGGRDGPGFFV